jgi:hypothetical protein
MWPPLPNGRQSRSKGPRSRRGERDRKKAPTRGVGMLGWVGAGVVVRGFERPYENTFSSETSAFSQHAIPAGGETLHPTIAWITVSVATRGLKEEVTRRSYGRMAAWCLIR